MSVELKERLARLEGDPTLRHSGARWRVHEELYPGRGAEQMIENLRRRDETLIAEFEALLSELRAKAPDDEAVAYCEWALSELRPPAPVPPATCPFHDDRAQVRNGMCGECAEMADDAR